MVRSYASPRLFEGSYLRRVLPSLLLNVAAPFLTYRFLSNHGVAPLPSLAATAIFPTLGTVMGFARMRRLDGIAAVSLVLVCLGLLTSLVTGEPRFFLVRETLITWLFGVACFGSLCLPRPLLFYLARALLAGHDRERVAVVDAQWQHAPYRQAMRGITALCGAGAIVDALARFTLAFAIPIPIFLVVSPLIRVTMIVALVVIAVHWERRARRRVGAWSIQRASAGA